MSARRQSNAQISLHDTGDTLFSGCDLGTNVGGDLWLVQMVLRRVSM